MKRCEQFLLLLSFHIIFFSLSASFFFVLISVFSQYSSSAVLSCFLGWVKHDKGNKLCSPQLQRQIAKTTPTTATTTTTIITTVITMVTTTIITTIAIVLLTSWLYQQKIAILWCAILMIIINMTIFMIIIEFGLE